MNQLSFPRINTLAARALARLVTGQQFTHRDFQNETASYRLASFIEQLRNRHKWPIETKEETRLTMARLTIKPISGVFLRAA
jgi:hypothetical protein